ncbi:MAG TPA: hypothetical protein VH796_12250 [Nitrososphaeraceae archaeon]
MADSRLLKQDTKQTAICDTVSVNSPVSDTCNQRSTNNVNNGVPKTTGMPETTGILRIICGSLTLELACPAPILLTGNNPQISTILCLICTHDIAIGPGPFTITAENVLGVTTISFSGNCKPTAPGSQEATGIIAAGQFLTCNINAG